VEAQSGADTGELVAFVRTTSLSDGDWPKISRSKLLASYSPGLHSTT
jgi:hypothetical protein